MERSTSVVLAVDRASRSSTAAATPSLGVAS
jgi:hypothetical protein